jgi:uncharacterized membrane protein (Fun14 family)
MNNNLDLKSLLNDINFAQISSGFLLGLSVGYFFKKGFKIMLFLLGLVTITIFWLNAQDYIVVSGNSIINIFDILSISLKKTYNFVYNNIASLEPLGGASIIAGFFTGLKIG